MEQTESNILVVNVKSDTAPSKQAGFIHAMIREKELTEILLQFVGAAASYQATKVVKILNTFLAYTGRVCFMLPCDINDKDKSGAPIVLSAFRVKVTNIEIKL